MKLARGSHVEPLLPVRLAIGFPQPGHQSHPWPEESYRPCGPWYLAQRTGPILKLTGKVIWSLFLRNEVQLTYPFGKAACATTLDKQSMKWDSYLVAIP